MRLFFKSAAGVTYDNTAGARCVFPFRFGTPPVLYYGCTQYTSGATYKMCATEIDSDYNAIVLGHCDDDCHVQVQLYNGPCDS